MRSSTDLAHVVVGVHQAQFHRALFVTRVHLRGDIGAEALAFLEAPAVVIADDVVHYARFHAAVEVAQVEKAS